MKDHFEFFIVCPIGWEDKVAQQIEMSRPFFIELNGQPSSFDWPKADLQKGGVTYKLPLHIGLQLNFFSKIGSRVLMRLGHFKANDFPILKQLIKKNIELESWLGKGPYCFKVSAQKSRLNNEKRILNVIEEVFGKSIAKENPQVFVRVDNDQFVFSLDTSGAHLHFRGQRLLSSTAPIRETIAHNILLELIGQRSFAELLNYQMIDLFAGSGTIGYEAASFFDGNRYRSFAFETWVKCPKIFKSETWKNNIKLPSPAFKRIVLADIDAKNCESTHKNVAAMGWQEHFELQNQDFFKLQRTGAGFSWLGAPENSLFVFNLPYGERLSLGMERKEFLQEVLNKVEELSFAEGILIFPPMANAKSLIVKQGTLDFNRQLNNSGIDVCLYHYKKR